MDSVPVDVLGTAGGSSAPKELVSPDGPGVSSSASAPAGLMLPGEPVSGASPSVSDVCVPPACETTEHDRPFNPQAKKEGSQQKPKGPQLSTSHISYVSPRLLESIPPLWPERRLSCFEHRHNQNIKLRVTAQTKYGKKLECRKLFLLKETEL